MRHRIRGRKLGRTTAHRKAMFRNQLTALFTHERIITTVAKAKELRPLAERMVTLARTGSLPARRKVLTMVPDKEVVQRLFDDIAPRFMDRPGGYTRVMRLGRRRGDGAELAIIEFVDYDLAEHEEGGTQSKGKASLMDRAKGVFGGGAKAAADEEVIEEETATPEGQEEAVAEPETEETDTVEEKAEVVEAAPAQEASEETDTVTVDDEPEAFETVPASEEPDTVIEEPEAPADEQEVPSEEPVTPAEEPAEVETETATDDVTDDAEEKKD